MVIIDYRPLLPTAPVKWRFQRKAASHAAQKTIAVAPLPPIYGLITNTLNLCSVTIGAVTVSY